MTATSTTAILQSAVDISTYDPDWFATHVLRCPNDDWQSDLLNAIADLDRKRAGMPVLFNHDLQNRFTIRSCHGTGKTHLFAKLMHWWNFTRKGRIPCTAPKMDQLTTRLWPEFRRILGYSAPWYRKAVKVRATTVTWHGDVDWCAQAETASSPENLQGFHDEWLLFLADEASGIDENMWPAIEGALTTPGSVLVMIGNPTKNQGEFYNSHMKPTTMRLYYRKHVRPTDSPRVDPEWISNMVLKYGEGSPVVQVRCYGNFAEMQENQLITLAWLDQAADTPADFTDGSIPRIRVSVDVADGGLDESVITVAKMFNGFTLFVAKRRCSFPPAVAPLRTADAAHEMGRLWGATDYVVDANGVGSGTAGTLMDRRLPVILYKGGASSSNPKRWRNQRVQAYISLRDELRDGRIGFTEEYLGADRDEVFAQMCSVMTVPGKGVEDLETKEAMKRRGAKSPDISDSAAMLFTTITPTIGSGSFVDGLAV